MTANETTSVVDVRDHVADERDRQARDRDIQANARQHEADQRDLEAEAADEHPSMGIADRDHRRTLTLLRRRAATERRAAAHDRVVAAADRDRAGLDRAIATQERADADEEREILQRDQLTGVLQRSVGLMALERELSRSSRFGTPLVVVFIDVDGLKRVNDQHGHDRGDEILRSLGDGLLSGMRPYDFAFRYGGDELVCVLPGLFAAQAEARFRVLQAKLASGTIPVPITFGIAERRPGESAEDLLRRADAELYDTWGRTSEHESLTVDPIGTETRAIAAHSLLNSAAVVSMGIETLQENWDRIPRTARLHMLERMLVHSGGIEASLKEMTQGREIAAGLLG